MSERLLCAVVPRSMPNQKAALGEEEYAVEPKLCVKGGYLKHWVAIPTVMVDDRECVNISVRSAFLTKMASGDKTLHEIHRKELGVLCTQMRHELTMAAKTENKTTTPIGKKKLNLDSDDEASGTAAPPKKKRKCAEGRWHQISLRGQRVLARLRAGTQIFIQSDMEAIQCLVQALKTKDTDNHLVAQSVAPLLDKPTDEIKQHLKKAGEGAIADEDKGRIKWRWPTAAVSGCWVVQYTTHDGKVHTKSKGYEVPKTDFRGNDLHVEEFKRIRQDRLALARAEWNKLDESDADRYATMA